MRKVLERIPRLYKGLALVMAFALLLANMPTEAIGSTSNEVESMVEEESINPTETTSQTDSKNGLTIRGLEDGALNGADSFASTDVTSEVDASAIEAIKAHGGFTNSTFAFKAYDLGLASEGNEVSIAGEVQIDVPTALAGTGDTYAVYEIDENGAAVQKTVTSDVGTMSYRTSSLNRVYVVAYTYDVTTQVSDTEYNVTVKEKTEGALVPAEDVDVKDVTSQTSETTKEAVISAEGLSDDAVTQVLNIELTNSANQEVQPEGTVTVSVKLPEGADPETFAMYYLGEDGNDSPVKVSGSVVDGYFVFERDHFCQFCLLYQDINFGQDADKANVEWFADNTEGTTFYVSTGADLRGLAALVKGDVVYKVDTGEVVDSSFAGQVGYQTATKTTFDGKTILLSCDITMDSVVFAGIGDSSSNCFKGTFDGNGHVIKNLHLDNTGSVVALFAYANSATIKNLGLEEPKYEATTDITSTNQNIAFLVGSATGTTVDSCYVYNASIKGNVKANNTHFSVISAPASATGFVAKNCYVFGLTTEITTEGTGAYDVSFKGLYATNDGQYVNCYVDEGSDFINFDGATKVEASKFTDNSATGVAKSINEAAGKEVFILKTKTENDVETVVSSHPIFGTGEAVVADDTTGMITVKVSNNGELSTKAGFLYFKYKDADTYGAASTTQYIPTVKGYSAPYIKTVKSDIDKPLEDQMYVFAGWYTSLVPSEETKIADASHTEITAEDIDGWDPTEDYTIYACYTGGPCVATVSVIDNGNPVEGHPNTATTVYGSFASNVYSASVTFVNSEGVESTTYTGDKNTDVTLKIKLDAVNGEKFWKAKGFLGWYISADDDVSTPDFDHDTFLGDADTAKDGTFTYKLTLRDSYKVYALFDEAKKVDVLYGTDMTTAMGDLVTSPAGDEYDFDTDGKAGYALYIANSGVYQISAVSKAGYVFAGWYSDAGCTNVVSLEKTISRTASANITYYAKFDPADTATVSKTGNVIHIEDEGQLLSKVVYQYSGRGNAGQLANDYSTAYRYSTWYKWCNNGLGYATTGVRKADYAANKNAYDWNGADGWHGLYDKAVKGAKVTVYYPGWYTFLMWPKDGGVMYSQSIYIDATDFGASYGEPSVTSSGTKMTIRANSSNIIAAYYQLSSTSVEANAVTEPASWYRFVVNGQATDVNSYDLKSYNGDEGYVTLGANVDGLEIQAYKLGWYTFWIKYDDGKIAKKLVCISNTNEDFSEDDANEIGAGVISFLQNTSVGTNAQIIAKVRYEAQSGATKYGLKFNNTVVETTEGTYGGYYLINANRLVCNTDYTVTPVYYANNTWNEFGNAKTIHSAAATVESYSSYYSENATTIGYRTNSGNVDVRGYSQGQSIKTSYSNQGWAVKTEGSPTVTYTKSARIVEGASHSKYVQMTYVLHNNSSTPVTNYKFGIWTDVMINDNDAAPVYATEYGFLLEDNHSSGYCATSGMSFAVIANKDNNVDGLQGLSTTCSNYWFGYWNDSQANAFSQVTTHVLTGMDSGAAMSWKDISIAPGDCYSIKVIMGVVETSALQTAVSTDPDISKDKDTATIDPNGNSSAKVMIDKVYYQYSSDDVASVDCPYDATSLYTLTGDSPALLNTSAGINLDGVGGFKDNGIMYKMVNGIKGYKTINGPNYTAEGMTSSMISANVEANSAAIDKANAKWRGDTIDEVEYTALNKVNFTTPGWYTFLIKYKEFYDQDTTDTSSDWAVRDRIKVVNIKITADDLTSLPRVSANGSTISIFNSGSDLSMVMYELSDYTPETNRNIPPTYYTTWTAFTMKGQGYDITVGEDGKNNYTLGANAAAYTAANSKAGYKTITSGLDGQDDMVYGCRTIIATAPGWYTFVMKYVDYAGESKSVTQYVYISAEDVAAGIPSISKSGNQITVNQGNGTLSSVVYQLTSYDLTTFDTEEAFKASYEYGAGTAYVTTGQHEYRTSNKTGDFTIFTRIGLFDEASDFESYVAPTYGTKEDGKPDYENVLSAGTDTRSPILLKINGKNGYRNATIPDATVDANRQVTGTTAVFNANQAGWYTIISTYAGGMKSVNYVKVTEEDVAGDAPTVTIDPETGLITLTGKDGHDIGGAFINYATDSTATEYPVNDPDMAYYLNDSWATYSWYGFWNYGATHYVAKTEDGVYTPGVNPTAGYYTINVNNDTQIGQYAVSTHGWYNVYVNYDGEEKQEVDYYGNPVTNEDGSPKMVTVYKTTVLHVFLPEDKTGPVATQYVVPEEEESLTGLTTIDGTACVDSDVQVANKRMRIQYTDGAPAGYKIKKYMYGYIGESQPSRAFDSWYGMCVVTDFNVQVEVPEGGIVSNGSGRAFDIVVDKAGYYVLYVSDDFYGDRSYLVYIDENGVPVFTQDSPMAIHLTVVENEISATKGNTTEKVAFIKDVTDVAASQTWRTVAYIKGDKLIAREGDARTIMAIDKEGRVSLAVAQMDSFDIDKSELEALLDKAAEYTSLYTKKTAEEYATVEAAGNYVIDTYGNALEALLVAEGDTPQAVFEDTDTTLAELDTAIETLRGAIRDFEANSKVIDPELVYVDGDTIKIQAPAGALVEYIIYSAQDEFTIDETGNGEREILATAWNSWAGISSGHYTEVKNLDRVTNWTYEINNVPDGVYSFQVKVDGKVYYRNPVVANGDDDEITVAKDYLNGSFVSYHDPSDMNIKQMAEYLKENVQKYSDWEENPTGYYVSDVLYDTLVWDLEHANKMLEEGHVKADEEEVKAHNATVKAELEAAKAANQEYTPDYWYTLKDLVDGSANLHNDIRRVLETRQTTAQQHLFEINCTAAATGSYTATNRSNNAIVVYVAKGKYDSWGAFSSVSFKQVVMNDSDPRTGAFQVAGDGEYTAYIKYADGVYEFKHFNLTGYAGYKLAADGKGAYIRVALNSGTEKSSVESLAIAYGIKDSYNATEKVGGVNVWTTLDPNNLTDNVLTTEVTTRILGMGEHTIYAKIDGEEYFIPAYPEGVPVVQILKDQPTYGNLVAFADANQFAWAAYAYSIDATSGGEGDANYLDSWLDMLQSASGVHYIALNESVDVPYTDSHPDNYMVYFKSKEGPYDYAVIIDYSTVDGEPYFEAIRFNPTTGEADLLP